LLVIYQELRDKS